ncbi:MAG: hypothetical protein COA79_11155 [Planctomycetota bacterium]|nr:MAG: hypothetical protein COA79_11155 [Planctomycetota bacterium]
MDIPVLSNGGDTTPSSKILEQYADKNSLIVPIESIEIPENLPRKDIDQLKELANNIQTQGVLVPLIVTKSPSFTNKKQTYSLLSGLRRFEAAKIIDLKFLPIRIFQSKKTEEKLAIQLSENIQRMNLKPVEIALIIKAFLEIGFKDQDISNNISKSLSWVSQYKKISKMPKKLLNDPFALKCKLNDLLSLEAKFLKHNELLKAWSVYKSDGLQSALKWPFNENESSEESSPPPLSSSNLNSRVTREFMIVTQNQNVLNCKLHVSETSKNDLQVILPKEFDIAELKDVFEKILNSIQAK